MLHDELKSEHGWNDRNCCVEIEWENIQCRRRRARMFVARAKSAMFAWWTGWNRSNDGVETQEWQSGSSDCNRFVRTGWEKNEHPSREEWIVRAAATPVFVAWWKDEKRASDGIREQGCSEQPQSQYLSRGDRFDINDVKKSRCKDDQSGSNDCKCWFRIAWKKIEGWI